MGIAFQTCGYCWEYWDDCRCTDESRRKQDEYAAKMRPIREAEFKARWKNPNYKGCSSTLDTVKAIYKKLYG